MAKPSDITDYERIASLQRFVLKERALLLHTGVPTKGFIGLSFGNGTRDIRDALDVLVIANRRREANRRTAEDAQTSTLTE
jgi:hypothetical protein